MSEQQGIPAGFERVPTGLGFTDKLQPLYRCVEGGAASFGLWVQEAHGNSLGICHGGVLMTLADLAAASGVNLARGAIAGAPTINLSLDFISVARIGQWVQADSSIAQVKRRFGFCHGLISTEEEVVARYNGTFYLPDHDGMWKGKVRNEGVLKGLKT